jgi:hypothetical protein
MGEGPALQGSRSAAFVPFENGAITVREQRDRVLDH